MTDLYSFQTHSSKESRNHTIEIDQRTKIINSKIEYSTKPILPKYLFKYYSCNRFSLDVIKTESIWASNPISFNDPFDCSPQFWDGNNFPYSEIKKLLYTLVVPTRVDACKNTNQLRELFFFVIRDFIGLYCLNEGTNQDLFWAYYGDDHKGFSIKFNQEKLSKRWSSVPLKIEYLEMKELLSQKLAIDKNVSDDFKALFPKLLRWISVKKESWFHENEWRYLFWVKPLDEKSRLKPYSNSAVDAIILGFKFFEESTSRYINSGIYKYSFKLPSNCKYSKAFYKFEMLRYLYQHPNIHLYQIALNEDLTLFEQRIYIKEIDGDTVTTQREFPLEQLAIMDTEL